MEEAERLAAEYADRIVSTSQPSGLTVDLSELQRKEGIARLVTLFMTWRLRFLNRLMWYNAARRHGKIGWGSQLRQFMIESALPAWAWLSFSALFVRPDKEYEWTDFAIQPLLDPVYAIPLLGDGTRTALFGQDFRLPAWEGFRRGSKARALLADGDLTQGTVALIRTFEWFAGLPISNIPADVIRLVYRHSDKPLPKGWR